MNAHHYSSDLEHFRVVLNRETDYKILSFGRLNFAANESSTPRNIYQFAGSFQYFCLEQYPPGHRITLVALFYGRQNDTSIETS